MDVGAIPATAMSPLALFDHAGLVGKSVIMLLLALSVWCWVLVAEAMWAIWQLRRAASPGASLFAPILAGGKAAGQVILPGESVGERRIRVAEAMHRAVQEAIERAERPLPRLAIIASAAPFIGLFGTVWGIMNAFIGIGAAQDTSLATVAPGIAEALAATAVGLAAAIPASVAYNSCGAALQRAAQALGRRVESEAVSLSAPALASLAKREVA